MKIRSLDREALSIIQNNQILLLTLLSLQIKIHIIRQHIKQPVFLFQEGIDRETVNIYKMTTFPKLSGSKTPVYSIAEDELNLENDMNMADEGDEKRDVFWTEQEERRVVWKMDCFILPFIVFGFFALQLDRSNLGNAMTDTIGPDLGVSDDDLAFGNSLQTIAIVVAELPSNYLLQWFGPHRWLMVESTLWGLVGVFQSFITNKSSYFATRWLLGMFEAGYIPGSLYYLSTFYKREEMAKRTAIFYFGNYFAAGVGSLLAAALLRAFHDYSWGAWRFLFLIDGMFTIVAAILFFFILPKGCHDTRPEHNMFSFFTKREQEILKHRILDDDPSKVSGDVFKVSRKQFIKALLTWRLWVHFAINVLSLAPKGALQVFGPKIIKSLGFNTYKANALNSVSSFACCILTFLICWAADKTSQKGLLCVVANGWSIVFAAVITTMTLGVTPQWTMYAIFILLASGNALSQALNDAWVNVNAKTPEQRSVGLALVVMGLNTGGSIGSATLFKDKDAPRYKPAFVGILALYCSSVVVIVFLSAFNHFTNKKLDKLEKKFEEEPEGEKPLLDPDFIGWRYHI